MFINKKFITNLHRKVKNPALCIGVNNKYQGQLHQDYNFKYQTNNFLNICKSLELFNIYPTEIYSSMRLGKSVFVVIFNNPNLIWQKYEGKALGSGGNYIYWKSHKINTTVWLSYSQTQIEQILNDIDPSSL